MNADREHEPCGITALDAEGVQRHMLARKHGKYTDADVRAIIKRYVTTCTAAGVDPLLVVSQLVLETSNLDSFWSQRPRRNPAGIGVTGEPGVGLSFPSWDDSGPRARRPAARVHDPEGKWDLAQRELIDEALRWRALPDSRRGSAPTIRGLAGTWAADPNYAVKLVSLANEIRAAA